MLLILNDKGKMAVIYLSPSAVRAVEGSDLAAAQHTAAAAKVALSPKNLKKKQLLYSPSGCGHYLFKCPHLRHTRH